MVPSVPRLPAVVIALLLTAGFCSGARAHAVLVESSPAADEVLAEAPDKAVLRFNEPVRPVRVRLLRAEDGAGIDLGAPEAADTALHVAIPETLAAGSYVLSYRVTSADGHPVAGSFVFTIGSPEGVGAMALAATRRDDDFWRVAGVASRALWYGTLLLAAGLALFLALIPAPFELARPLRRALPWLALAGMIATLVMLGATGGALLGDPLAALLTPEPWRIALGSPVALSGAIAGAGLIVLVLGKGAVFEPEQPRLLAGALLVASSFGASGHAATAGPSWVTMPALSVHALCAAYWVGAFVPLFLGLRRLPRGEAVALVQAFSRLAVLAVACLLLAGIVISALQLRAPSALIATDYGRLLLLKLGLVAGLLGLAAVNRWVLTPALEGGEDGATWLRRTIATDLALATGIVVATASLGAVPPPRALAEQGAHAHAHHAARDHAVHAAARGHHLVLVATPAATGDNRIDLFFTDDQNRPVEGEGAELSLTLPERGIEPLRLAAEPVEPGHYRARSLLPLAGDWRVRVDLLVDDFTKLAFQTRIAVER
jgi:copper transport protein